MRAQDYFEQSKHLDSRINLKLEQVDTLKELAKKCTSTLSDMPRNQSNTKSSLEDTIVKIVMLQNEINEDIDELVDFKAEMRTVIDSLENVEHQMVLEQCYINQAAITTISENLNYSIQHIYRLRSEALQYLDERHPLFKFEKNVME